MDEINENDDRCLWEKDEVSILVFWNLEQVLRSLIKQDILIGWMADQNLCN